MPFKYLCNMADVHSAAIRSYNMSRIKGKDTKPEMLVRKFLHAQGFRYRLHDKKLPGKPDIVLPKYRTVIFVHGCFWHGHKDCRKASIPKTRTMWWRSKISATMQNDSTAVLRLLKGGWQVIEIWECELSLKSIANAFQIIQKKILSRFIN
jgi:DNA mismatch endonuclease, patch repair protein